MPDKKSTLLGVILLLSVTFGWSQNVRKIILQPDGRISNQERVTAIAIRSPSYLGGSVRATIGSNQIDIPLDPDAPDYTYFTSLENPQESGQINFESIPDAVVYLINSGKTPNINLERYRLHQEDCQFEFDAIPQSEWRAGLDAPSYTRSFTDVSHVVVHHSAGSNTNTNYIQVVRDIYLYHTNTNGWSDIGYNYLIAQDGSVYTGRDPGSGAQDNVLGAHFCGSNSGTMGVCLLGNYEDAEPTNITLSSLTRILAFKLDKETLDPFGSSPHALGQLGAIVGHRDGCNTACPGENVYSGLSDLRDRTQDLLDDCEEPSLALDFTYDRFKIDAGESVSFENKSSGYDAYQWLLEGASPRLTDWKTRGTASYTLPGTFGVRLVGFTAQSSDTLYRPEIITVMDRPVVYPNPVTTMGTFRVASTSDVKELQLTTLSGKTQSLTALPDGSYQVPAVEQGMYLVKITTVERDHVKKLIVK